MVSYSGRPPGHPAYQCERPNLMLGLRRCFTFGGLRVDAAVTRELLRAVEPMESEQYKDGAGEMVPLYAARVQDRDCREIGGHAAIAAGGCGSLAAWKRRPVISPPPHTPNL